LLHIAPFVKLASFASAVLVAAMLPIAWWVGGVAAVAGALCGAAAGLGSFAAAAWLLHRLLAVSRARAAYAVLLGIKLIVLALVVFVLVRVLGLHAFGLLMGYTAVLIGLVVSGAVHARHGETTEEPPGGEG